MSKYKRYKRKLLEVNDFEKKFWEYIKFRYHEDQNAEG